MSKWCVSFFAGYIYPTELQLNKANTSDKQYFFPRFKYKIIGSDVHTSVYDKRDDFGFPIVKYHGYVVMFLDSRRTVFTFRSWFDLRGIVLAFLISDLTSSNHFKTIDIGLQILQTSKNIWTILLIFCPNFLKHRFTNTSMFLTECLTRVFYGDLVFK